MIFTLHNRYIPETPVRNTKRVSDSMDSEMTKKKRNTSGTPHTVAAPWTPINPNAPAFIPSHAPFHFEGNQDSQIDISQDPVNYGLLQQMGRLAQPLYDKDRIKKPDDIEGYNYKLERWHEMDDDEFCYVGDQVPNPVADAKAGL